MTPQRFIDFRRRLTRESAKKIFLVLDNLRVHHGQNVKNWLAENKDNEACFTYMLNLYLITSIMKNVTKRQGGKEY
jgi:hypothetical protein